MAVKHQRPDDPYPWRKDPDLPPVVVGLLDKLADLGLHAADLMDADTDGKTGKGRTYELGAVGIAIMEPLSMASNDEWDAMYLVGKTQVTVELVGVMPQKMDN